jgi:hypothetical protein
MGFSPFRSLLRGTEAEPVARPLPFVLKETELDEPEPPENLGISRSADDPVPKNPIRPHPGIHQDLSSGSPENMVS